jgi:hypothetical protein
MSAGSDGSASAAASLERGRVAYFPVVPGSLEFAVEVRRALLEARPAAVAVELPAWLARGYTRAVERLPEMTALVYEQDRPGGDEQAIYIVVEPCDPFAEAVRTALEVGARLLFLEPGQAAGRPHLPDAYPDTYALRTIGRERYIERYRLFPQARDERIAAHAAAMAGRLRQAVRGERTTVVASLNLIDALLEAMETPQPAPPAHLPREATLLNPHPDCLAEITCQPPWLQERYENWRAEAAAEPPDRRRALLELLREAEFNYTAQTGDKIAHWQRRLMSRFARNLAVLDGQMVAGLFDLVSAARAVVDDNYGWEVWNAANAYSFQREQGPLETVSLSGEEVFLHTRKLKLRRRRPPEKRRRMPRGLKPRKRETRPGEWAEKLDGAAICSYPPEDIVIEDYGKFLRGKARSMLTEERVRVEPFTTSILDGIDIRETIRDWRQGKIWVRRQDRRAGDAGAVVVIFDQDRENRYTYLTTWLGEHANESDMAFYSTQPFERLVGPGIGRAEYGGFLMVLPPRRMYDVWTDPDYDFAQSKSERLLLAALDYSLERHVLYVAAQPPRSIFRSIAARLDRSILYVPIGQLSSAKLKKIRVVHVLDSHARRAAAKDYIW